MTFFIKDFFRCVAVREEKGKDIVPCEYFRAAVAQACPQKWTAEWDEQRAQGCFPANKVSISFVYWTYAVSHSISSSN